MDVQADLQTQRVTVLGKTDPHKVLKKARKIDKKAEIVTEPPKTEAKAEKAEKKAEEKPSEEKKAEEKKPEEKKTEEKKPEEKPEKKSEEKPKDTGETKQETKKAEDLASDPSYRFYYTGKPMEYWGPSPNYYPPYSTPNYMATQSYLPYYYYPQYPETDYSAFYTNPDYLKHVPPTYYWAQDCDL